MDNQEKFNTPILFIIFNRPEETQLVFNEIKKIKPKQLFVVADGPRNESEKIKCSQTQAIINQIDWNCDIKTNYSEQNLGCKRRVASGIDWFFKNVEQGIILEDDCVPSEQFFWFCQELLNYYKTDKKVMHISGSNMQKGKNKTKASYYFSKKQIHVWGWATWKEAWGKYDIKMVNWPNYKKSKKYKNLFNNQIERKEKTKIMDKTFQGKVDTWDHQWAFACFFNEGMGIIPNSNLISNIGFNDKATHSKNKNNILNNLSRETIDWPLIHPKDKELNPPADNLTFQLSIKNKFSNFFQKIINKLTKNKR